MTASGSWKTSSGLLDDFDFSIEEAWFGTNEKFGDAVLLNLRGIAEQMVEGEMAVVDDEHVLLYSCGEGWEAAKGGREATHGAGKTTFTNNSNMGRLIDAIVALGGDVLEELGTRGESYEADTWEGLKFHIERKTFTFRNRETGENVSYEVPLPTDYLGTFDVEEEEAPKKKAPSRGKGKGSARGSKAGSKATPKRKPSRSKAKAKAEPEEEENDLRDAVIEFGAEYEDHATFVEEVFDPDVFDRAEELQEDEELSEDVLDEDGSVWTDILEAAE